MLILLTYFLLWPNAIFAKYNFLKYQIYNKVNRFQMQGPAPQPNREQPQRNKQIIFVIAIYLVLTMFSHFTTEKSPFSKSIITMINNTKDINITTKNIIDLFTIQNYVGQWSSLDPKTLEYLPNGQGVSKIRIGKIDSEGNQFEFEFKLNNGQYIDDGVIFLSIQVRLDEFQTEKIGKTVIFRQKKSTNNQTNTSNTTNRRNFFRHQKILQNLQQKYIQINQFNLNITYSEETNKLYITFDIQSKQTLKGTIILQKQQTLMLSTIIFAILLFVISYGQFSAVMEMLKSIFQGYEFAGNYSIVTILVATLWDAVLCVVAFMQAFTNEESLILFIMPAFLLCLLFTNLELRILLLIFQARAQNRNIREIICKFNIITYGSLIVMYPILIYTNLSSIFFIVISLLLLPQIYLNAMNSQRPNVQSAYYTKFLTIRFVIILYLRCFPWNIFDLEPNYFLGFTCTALLAFQLFLLWVQKNYGPKKILPKFLLPPVFNYGCQNQISVQQGFDQTECSICLTGLQSQPQGVNSSLNVPFRIMRAPCGHKFHGACLGQWMQIKMQCPQCRGPLPPFQ